jgi:hypothetical protein
MWWPTSGCFLSRDVELISSPSVKKGPSIPYTVHGLRTAGRQSHMARIRYVGIRFVTEGGTSGALFKWIQAPLWNSSKPTMP